MTPTIIDVSYVRDIGQFVQKSMLISHKHNFIYLKTTKTASTSIEALFEPLCMYDDDYEPSHSREQYVSEKGIVGKRGLDVSNAEWYNHMPASELRQKIGPEKFEEYHKFTSIRNPFSKEVSRFYHERRFCENHKQNYWQTLEKCARHLRQMSLRVAKWQFEKWLKSANCLPIEIST